MLDCNQAWENFIDDEDLDNNVLSNSHNNSSKSISFEKPICSELYISTQTKISYLSQPLNIVEAFWNIPTIPYHKYGIGVIKKQIKINFSNQEDLNEYKKNLSKENFYVDDVLLLNKNSSDNFKEIHKLSVGLSTKDISTYKCKKKGAFYNCFVLVLRVIFEGKFKEGHIKIFNTGKLEIPGIQSDSFLLILLENLEKIINLHYNKNIKCNLNKTETVLINSNFNCGYFLDRDKLYDILKEKYKLKLSYDPCSYPGIMVKYNYNKKIQISFMIFRTGSVLIVGKCSKIDIHEIYKIIKQILHDEYENIYISRNCFEKKTNDNDNKKKIRKKTILVKKN